MNRRFTVALFTLLSVAQVSSAQPTPKPEPISKRLIGELIHPNNPRILGNIHVSPDGERVIAGDYPGGLVAVWEVASRKCLFTVDAGAGAHHTSEYLALSPDWKKFYVPRWKRKIEWIVVDGNKEARIQYDGDVRAYDTSDGKLLKTYRHEPPRAISYMRLSPDGTRLITSDEASGSIRASNGSISLWDVQTGEHRFLPKDLGYWDHFDPTGRLHAGTKYEAGDNNSFATALSLTDLQSMREKWSTPIQHKRVLIRLGGFSPDGKLLVGDYRDIEPAGPDGKADKWKDWIKWWDAATGKEVLSFASVDGESSSLKFSPDGRTLMAVSAYVGPKHIRLFNVAERRLTATFMLDRPPEKFGQYVRGFAFSPDSRWLVVAHQLLPLEHDDTITPLVVQQPRILLIDVAAGKIRETMISPPGYASSICFSRDGRRMATSGYGKVLLWDMSDLAGR